MKQRSSAERHSIEDVASYWQEHPLLFYETDTQTRMDAALFEALDVAKRADAERFSLAYWDFAAYRGKRVLDIGCGPGWFATKYAAAGAEVTAVDLTERAVTLTRGQLGLKGLQATVRQANAEELPFPDASFDLVFSSGVLHHTPRPDKAFREAFRVLRPRGDAKITLYRLTLLHARPIFPLVRLAMRGVRLRHPGADLAATNSVEEFVRQYDGTDNPIGIAKTSGAWRQDLEQVGFRVDAHEHHFFPRRMLPRPNLMPEAVHRLIDRSVGLMVYFRLGKP